MTLLLRVLPHLHIERSSSARSLPPTHPPARSACTARSTRLWGGQASAYQASCSNHSGNPYLSKLDYTPHASNSGQRNIFLCVPAYSHVSSWLLFLETGGMTSGSVFKDPGCCSLVALNLHSPEKYSPKQNGERIQENSTAAPCLLTIYSLSFYFSFANELVSKL